MSRASPIRVVGAQTANERSRGLPFAGEVMRSLFTGKGMLTYSPSIVAASVKVLEESATPDVQVTFAPGSFKGGQIGEFEETPGLRLAPSKCGPYRAAMSRPSRTVRARRPALPMPVMLSASAADAPGCDPRQRCFALSRPRP
jgi:hypothetical protein